MQLRLFRISTALDWYCDVVNIKLALAWEATTRPEAAVTANRAEFQCLSDDDDPISHLPLPFSAGRQIELSCLCRLRATYLHHSLLCLPRRQLFYRRYSSILRFFHTGCGALRYVPLGAVRHRASAVNKALTYGLALFPILEIASGMCVLWRPMWWLAQLGHWAAFRRSARRKTISAKRRSKKIDCIIAPAAAHDSAEINNDLGGPVPPL